VDISRKSNVDVDCSAIVLSMYLFSTKYYNLLSYVLTYLLTYWVQATAASC